MLEQNVRVQCPELPKLVRRSNGAQERFDVVVFKLLLIKCRFDLFSEISKFKLQPGDALGFERRRLIDIENWILSLHFSQFLFVLLSPADFRAKLLQFLNGSKRFQNQTVSKRASKCSRIKRFTMVSGLSHLAPVSPECGEPQEQLIDFDGLRFRNLCDRFRSAEMLLMCSRRVLLQKTPSILDEFWIRLPFEPWMSLKMSPDFHHFWSSSFFLSFDLCVIQLI